MKSSVPEHFPPGRGVSSWLYTESRSPSNSTAAADPMKSENDRSVTYDVDISLNRSFSNSPERFVRKMPKAELLLEREPYRPFYNTDVRRNHYSTPTERLGIDNVSKSVENSADLTQEMNDAHIFEDYIPNVALQVRFEELVEHKSSPRTLQNLPGDSKMPKDSGSKTSGGDWQSIMPVLDELGFPQADIMTSNGKENGSPKRKPRSTYQIANESMELISCPIITKDNRTNQVKQEYREINNSHPTVALPPKLKTKSNKIQSVPKKTHKQINTQTSHDEMSPLMQQPRKALIHHDADFKHLATSENDVTISSNIAICGDDMNAKNKHKQKNDPDIIYSDDKIQTPIKYRPKGQSIRLNQSWLPSPISYGGSFAILDDSNEYKENMKAKNEDDKAVLQHEFIEVVAAIVIQTFFRRHLAYKLTCRRYRAVFIIQRFWYHCLYQKKNRSMQLRIAKNRVYNVAATQIQAIWRGFWTRDSILVRHYCATLIQRFSRGYCARLHFKYDVCRIILAQSVARRFLTLHSNRRHAAATLIQSQWRCFICSYHFINRLADILIVQSVCRRWLIIRETERKKQIAIALKSKRPIMTSLSRSFTHSPKTLKEDISKGRMINPAPEIRKNGFTGAFSAKVVRPESCTPPLSSPSESTSRSEQLAQLDTDELIRRWKNRRPSPKRKQKNEFAEF